MREDNLLPQRKTPLDAFARKAVGWAFLDTLDASLAIAALDKAIAARSPARGSLIHHSDRGVQYMAYRQRLADRDIAVRPNRSTAGIYQHRRCPSPDRQVHRRSLQQRPVALGAWIPIAP